MVDAKQAVKIAMERAAEMLGAVNPSLEEIERDSHKDREVWDITLSFPRDVGQLSPVARISADPLKYKRFLIDVDTGELVAIKLRELASQ